MTILVQITNTHVEAAPAVVVTLQSIREGGRELVPNGTETIPPGATHDYLIHAGQSLRVAEIANTQEPQS